MVQLGRDRSLSAARDRRVAAARVLQVRPAPRHLFAGIPALLCTGLCFSTVLLGLPSTGAPADHAIIWWACREVYGQQEYDFHVYKELMWGEEAGAPYLCSSLACGRHKPFCMEALYPIPPNVVVCRGLWRCAENLIHCLPLLLELLHWMCCIAVLGLLCTANPIFAPHLMSAARGQTCRRRGPTTCTACARRSRSRPT